MKHKHPCEVGIDPFRTEADCTCPTTPIEDSWVGDFVETAADLEHKRWASWQKFFFEQCIFQRNDGKWIDLTLPVPKYEHWLKQINTPYAELSELEKESDRKEVRTYLPLVGALLATEKARVVAIVENEMRKNEDMYGMTPINLTMDCIKEKLK